MVEDRDTQGNSLCFVHRLPTETLETIFIHCACDYYHRIDPALPVPTWVNVSYVSRRWRHVALNCPTLWTYLFITSSRWTEELLARSRKAPLKLCAVKNFHDKNKRAVRCVKQVLNHVGRIQVLRLLCNKDVLSNLTLRAPCLQHLEISLANANDRSNWFWQPFGGDAPALRTLRLSYCPVPWYSLKLSGLTTLELSSIPAEFQQRTEDFLATLSCMQDLTHLHLDATLASAAGFLSSAAFHTFQKFDLPHLSRLKIIAQPSTVAALLSCINIPLKAELRLNSAIRDRSPSPDHYTLLCSLLAQRFSMSEDERLYGQRPRTLLISFAQWGDVDIAFGTLEHDFNVNSFPLPFGRIVWDRHFPLQIIHHISYVTTYDNWERIISHTCCPIPLSNIQSLYVSQPRYSQTFWTHVLGHLPGLRYLKLSHGRMPAIATLLSLARHDCTENQGRHSDLSGIRIFVPELEDLELKDIRFSTALQTDVPNTLAVDVQSLYDALSTRKDPRVRLTMVHCTERDSNGQDKGIARVWRLSL